MSKSHSTLRNVVGDSAPPPSLHPAGSAFIRVNYGINRRLQGRRFVHRNGTMRIKGEWLMALTHEKIKRIITRRHPGWNITGWALVTPNRVISSNPPSKG